MVNINKKKILGLSLAITMSLGSLGSPVFATEIATLSADGNTKKVAEKNEPQIIKLSIEDAYKKMDKGLDMELIKIRTLQDQGISNKYSESVDKFKKTKAFYKDNNIMAVVDSTAENVMKAKEKFAESVFKDNEEARIKKLHRDVFEKYFKLQNMEYSYKVATDNLALAKQTFKNTKLKFQVGSVSKMAVMSAEKGVNSALNNLEKIKIGLSQAKMSLNLTLGLPLDTVVILTSNLTEKDTLNDIEIDFKKEYEKSLKENLGIKEAKHLCNISEINFHNYEAYPIYSGSYLQAKAQFLSSKLNMKTSPQRLYMSLKYKYDNFINGQNSLKRAKEDSKNASEMARLVQLQYKEGMTTIDKVNETNLNSYMAHIKYGEALLNLKLAKEDWFLSIGKGIEPATI